MGGWDYYCFICATGFVVPFEPEDPDSEEEDQDTEDNNENSSQNESQDQSKALRPRSLFPKETTFQRLQWLTKFRTIGQNRSASGLTNCYISGPAEILDYGQASVRPGNHPNAQDLGDNMINCYRDNDDEENGDLPVHDNCFAILCKVFAGAQGINYSWTPDQPSTSIPMSLDSLFSCLANSREDYCTYLQLDHGFEQPDQYFNVEWDRIFHYFDPLEDTEIQPSTLDVNDKDSPRAAIDLDKSSLFDALPHELLIQILDLIPQADLVPSIQAVLTIRQVAKTDKFWHRRLQLDAPWLWEYRDDNKSAKGDLHTFYNAVMMQTCKPLEEAARGKRVSGLANRRRIWHVCEQILHLYERIDTVRGPQDKSSIFEEGVVCRYLPMVASRARPHFKSEAAFFFNNQSDVALAKHLTLKWTVEGALYGICLKTKTGQVSFGDIDNPNDTESVMKFAPGDWIEKMVLNISVIYEQRKKKKSGEQRTRLFGVTGIAVWHLSGDVTYLGMNDGFKRLLEPLPGNGIVGLKSQFSDGVINHLGLLEHPAGLTNSRPANDPKRLDLLWNDHVPPADLRFRDYGSGYWSNSSMDLVPMHCLLFGSTDLEQSTMTGIGVAADLAYFEIYRSDGSSEQIGQRQAPKKTFLIDGPGGERIAGLDYTIGHLPVGLTLVTTHGRQVAFGRRVDNALNSDHGLGLAGFYCSFGYNSTGKDLLSSIGTIASPHIQRPSQGIERLEDGNNLLWEPRPPPPSWQIVGPVYGKGHRGEVAVVLDFSRPIARIDGLFPAPEWMAEIEIGGFTIMYADGNTLEPSSHLGFPPQGWPTSANAKPEDLAKMERYPAMSRGFTTNEDSGVAHVLTDKEALAQPTSWDLGQQGEKLVAVTVWAGDYLHGIQFHSEGGKDSPRWGKCGGKPAAKISAGGEDRIVGLKMILGARRLDHTAPTLSPQAVQAFTDLSG